MWDKGRQLMRMCPHSTAAPLHTCWFQDPCVPAQLVKLCGIDLLHTAANLTPLADGQAAVGAEGALQGLITGGIKGHLGGPAACCDAALAGCLSIVPAMPTGEVCQEHCWRTQEDTKQPAVATSSLPLLTTI